MSACRGHADLTPGCTECALEDARTEVSRLNALDKKRCEEIQRLHRLLAQSEADWTTFRQEHDKAKAEVERLREALRVIANSECNCDGWGGPCGCGERAVATAEDALAEPPVEHRPAMAQMAAALRKKARKEREREEP